jgi:predicted MFS family arabinose efflux permease
MDKRILRTLIVLALAQMIGWGTVGLLAVVGTRIGADLHMDVTLVFAGNSVFYVAMALSAPLLARAFARFGARRVMIAGTLAAVPGFVLLALAQGPMLYFAAWIILGLAGSATLATAAYILLNEIAGRRAKSAIGSLMLTTGLSSSIFWPTTAFLADLAGWRVTALVYAGAVALVCLPLYVFGLPRQEAAAEAPRPEAAAAEGAPAASRGTFYLIATAIALNAFVTYGFSAVLIELLKARGVPPSEAIGFGSLLGIIQVSARGIDFLGGARWDGLTTGLFAGLALPVAMLLLIAGGGTGWPVLGFILLYGLGSGALAVARATIPLVFYDRAAYARAASHIALPLNLLSSMSSPILMALLVRFGGDAVLELAMFCSFGAFLILLVLSRRRPRVEAVATA